MKSNMKRLFSLSVTDTEYFANTSDKFELEKCPMGKVACQHLAFMNESYREMEHYHLSKEYIKAIKALEKAFDKTQEIKATGCTGCSRLFRSTIINSMAGMQNELEKMTTGLFKAKKFQPSHQVATKTLKKFRTKSKTKKNSLNPLKQAG